MEPISLTASIIALVGAGASVAKGLRKLTSLKHIPDSLLRLNNEISDLQLLISAVQDLCCQHNESLGEARRQHGAILDKALKKAKTAVLELEVLIAYGLTKATAGRKIDRFAWMREEGKIQLMENRLYTARMDIIAATSILNLGSTRRLENHLHRLHLSTEGLVSQGQSSERLLQNVLQSVKEDSAHSSSRDGSTERPVESSKIAISSGLSWVPSRVSTTQYCPDGASIRTYPGGPVRFDLTYIRSCRTFCSCSCHRQTRLRSPDILDFVLGSLLVTYNSWPLTIPSRKCNLSSCRRQGAPSAEITYTFPRWFIHRVITIKVQSRGPELLLRVLRVRPKNTAIFLALENNYTEIAKDLLATGDASVLDVDEEGQSLIHCALGRYWPTRDILKVLLDAGADIMQEDNNGVTPYMEIWKYHLVNSPFSRGYDIFGDELQTDHFEFSPLHAVVLGLKSAALEPTIDAASRHLLNQKDAMGRTALSWAVLCGDVHIVKRLLSKGANPNIEDSRGSTPLHHWVNQGSGQVLNALLDAGANINAKDLRGRTTLMEVLRCRGLDVDILQKLFAAKPDVNTQGIQGCAPTQTIPGLPKVSCSTTFSDWLVWNESNINARTIYDRTPLMSPVGGEDHRLVKKVLNLEADYTLLDSENRSLLHIAADYGDLRCLELLRQADLRLLWPDRENGAGNTPMDIAIWRRDHNDAWSRWAIREPDAEPQEWFNAFNDLYLSIKLSRGKEIAHVEGSGSTSGDGETLRGDAKHEDEAQRSLPGTFPQD